MKKFWFILLSVFTLAALAGKPLIELEKANTNIRDNASLKRGAQFFAKHCLICHSLKYLRYDPIAESTGITFEKMPVADQKWWLGAAPPDLTLMTRAKGVDWVYTYLLGFYKDVSTRFGSSNLLAPNVSMPNPFLALQGEQQLVVNKEKLLTHGFEKRPKYSNALKLVRQGTMLPNEFDKSINDLVNFLAYAADPVKLERYNIGIFVILFLIIFAIIAYLLQREYWKDVKRKQPPKKE